MITPTEEQMAQDLFNMMKELLDRLHQYELRLKDLEYKVERLRGV